MVGTVHYGNTPLVRGCASFPRCSRAHGVRLLLAGVYIVRTRGGADRERMWAGMARESAHQLGTPLSSLSGWIELLARPAATRSTMQRGRSHMDADLERLKRVANRFERIGRPPRREKVDIGELVDASRRYFRARVPTLANASPIDVARATSRSWFTATRCCSSGRSKCS